MDHSNLRNPHPHHPNLLISDSPHRTNPINDMKNGIFRTFFGKKISKNCTKNEKRTIEPYIIVPRNITRPYSAFFFCPKAFYDSLWPEN